MIVVVIIGILAAIAIPAYLNYTRKAKVTEGISMAGPMKMEVNEYASSNGSLPAANQVGTLDASDSAIVNTVVYDGTDVTVTYTSEVETGGTLVFTPSMNSSTGVLTWVCTSTLSDEYTPASCK
jgi:type IV pilus assembly protein PilA